MPQAMVIDDNKFNVSILMSYLKEQGFDTVPIIQPNQVEAALDTLEDLQVVFLDLEMPGIDGFDILKMMKKDARLQDIPVIAHSVHISEIKVAHDAGFDGFIGKPLNADKFPKQLARILEGKGVWETA